MAPGVATVLPIANFERGKSIIAFFCKNGNVGTQIAKDSLHGDQRKLFMSHEIKSI
jgi:hypothetical protein